MAAPKNLLNGTTSRYTLWVDTECNRAHPGCQTAIREDFG